MLDLVVTVVSFFAAYGLAQIFVKGLLVYRLKKERNKMAISRVLMVYNCEDTIEGMIRTIAWEDIQEEIVVLDLGSTDQTMPILYRLLSEYLFLRVMTYEEYLAYLATQKKTLI